MVAFDALSGTDCSHDGIFNTLSAYYSTEELYFCEREVLFRDSTGFDSSSSLVLRGIKDLYIKITIPPTLSRTGRPHSSLSTDHEVLSSRT